MASAIEQTADAAAEHGCRIPLEHEVDATVGSEGDLRWLDVGVRDRDLPIEDQVRLPDCDQLIATTGTGRTISLFFPFDSLRWNDPDEPDYDPGLPTGFIVKPDRPAGGTRSSGGGTKCGLAKGDVQKLNNKSFQASSAANNSSNTQEHAFAAGFFDTCRVLGENNQNWNYRLVTGSVTTHGGNWDHKLKSSRLVNLIPENGSPGNKEQDLVDLRILDDEPAGACEDFTSTESGSLGFGGASISVETTTRQQVCDGRAGLWRVDTNDDRHSYAYWSPHGKECDAGNDSTPCQSMKAQGWTSYKVRPNKNDLTLRLRLCWDEFFSNGDHCHYGE